jgi:hypothetical protein
MRRAWLLFLAFLLPLHMTWAAVADCHCPGESTSAALHTEAPGPADVAKAAVPDEDIDADAAGCALDCHSCHPNWGAPSPEFHLADAAPAARPSAGSISPPEPVYPHAPERPNWCRFA